MRFKILLTSILSLSIANGYLLADDRAWLNNVYKEANTKDTLLYFVWTEYDQWHANLKRAIKARKLNEAKQWYDAIEQTVRINFVKLGDLQRNLSDCPQTKAFADKCFEVIREGYKRERVSRCFTMSLACSSLDRVHETRKENFDSYGLDMKVMDMYFSEDDPDEFQYVAEFVPKNLLIDGEIDGNRAVYYDGTTHMYSPDREHSEVANLIAREYGSISRLFKDGRNARRFLAFLFEKCPRARLFEEKYREILPRMKGKAATEGKLSSQDAYEFLR